jgi:serine/threonine-protein kinase
LWGIAVIAYECLVGRRPFTGDSFGELVIAICTRPVPVPSQNASVPAGFDEWFVKGTQRDRNRRFGSAREMVDELVKLSASAGTSRAPFATGRNLPVVAAPAPASPRVSAGPARAPSVDPLDLTTGQRAVTSESLNHSRAPRSAAVYVLIAAAVLIVAGVGAFVASGGASAFKSATAPQSAAAALTATPPIASPNPVLVAPTPPVAPVASELPTPAAASASAALPVAAAPSASPTPVTKPGTKSKPEPVTKPAPTTSAPANKDPLPPKNWEF